LLELECALPTELKCKLNNNMQLKKISLFTAIASCLFGIWTCYVYSRWTFKGVNMDIILNFVWFLGCVFISFSIGLILYIFIPRKHKSSNTRKILLICNLVSVCLLVAFIIGIFAGEKILKIKIEYTKKQAEPIIQAIESYYNNKGSYPARLENLNIPIPEPKTGGKFSYDTDFYKITNKQEFSLSTSGYYGWVRWQSWDKKWYINIEHDRGKR
jgi:hypothetical protein